MKKGGSGGEVVKGVERSMEKEKEEQQSGQREEEEESKERERGQR